MKYILSLSMKNYDFESWLEGKNHYMDLIQQADCNPQRSLMLIHLCTYLNLILNLIKILSSCLHLLTPFLLLHLIQYLHLFLRYPEVSQDRHHNIHLYIPTHHLHHQLYFANLFNRIRPGLIFALNLSVYNKKLKYYQLRTWNFFTLTQVAIYVIHIMFCCDPKLKFITDT